MEQKRWVWWYMCVEFEASLGYTVRVQKRRKGKEEKRREGRVEGRSKKESREGRKEGT
jgi:hypothetical protein